MDLRRGKETGYHALCRICRRHSRRGRTFGTSLPRRHGDFRPSQKPSFSPPGWVFPAAWTLYILMAVSAAMIAGERTKQSRDALFTYCAQLFVNFWWSIFFFAWGLRLTAFFLAASAARSRRGDGDSVRKYPSRSRKIEHSVSPVAGFRRRVEYIGIHFKQVKRFRMARNWFAGQFLLRLVFHKKRY